MTKEEIKSLAFQQALLQSEKRRIYGVIAFVVAFTLVVAIRILLYGSAMSPWGSLASLVLVAYELVVLAAVDRALRTKTDLPSGLWFLTLFWNSLFQPWGWPFWPAQDWKLHTGHWQRPGFWLFSRS